MDNITLQHLKLKNAFNKQQNNIDIFKQYFYFCFKCVQSSNYIGIDNLLTEMELVLEKFSTTIDFTEESITLIDVCRQQLDSLYQQIDSTIQTDEKQKVKQLQKDNDNTLKELKKLKNDFKGVIVNQVLFDISIEKMEILENKLHKEYFTQQQKVLYKELTTDFATLVSETMKKLQYKTDSSYNKTLVSSFKECFEYAKNNDKECKNYDETFRQYLISNNFFCFDNNRLFQGTQTYYTYVYSYIFGKMTDESKFKFTEDAINGKKI